MRDIAKAAGMSTGTVYRMFGSKDELLVSIMQSYSDNAAAAWDHVVRSASSPVEQLDALLWVNINVLDRFSEEFKIQLAWLRQSPPNDVGLRLVLRAADPPAPAAARSRRAGGRAPRRRRLGAQPRPLDLRADPHARERGSPRGPRGAHALARDTVLRGAMVRS